MPSPWFLLGSFGALCMSCAIPQLLLEAQPPHSDKGFHERPGHVGDDKTGEHLCNKTHSPASVA
eukprot:scaffold117756_cov32-Prasinocladus_malaysianus.AAC.1